MSVSNVKKFPKGQLTKKEKDLSDDLIGFGQHLGSRNDVVLKADMLAASKSKGTRNEASPKPGHKYGIQRPKLPLLSSSSPVNSPRELLPFVKDDVYTDTVLVVEGKRLYIHSSLLGYASPYFLKLLQSVHRTGADGRGKVELKITDKSYHDIVDLLSFIHPGVFKDLTEKVAVRLLPIADEYGMHAVKRRCEDVLLKYLKKNATLMTTNVPKGPPIYKFRRDNAPEILLKCTRAADRGNSKVLMDQCLQIFSNPEIPLKDLKASNEVSDQVKARIYETRVDAASYKLDRVFDELEKEKHENDILKSQLTYRSHGNKTGGRNHPLNSSDNSLSDEKHPIPLSVPTHHSHHYHTHRRQNIHTKGKRLPKPTLPDISPRHRSH